MYPNTVILAVSHSFPDLVDEQLELLEEQAEAGEIDGADVEAIRQFVPHDVARVKDGTVRNHLTVIRTAAARSLTWSGRPLVDLDLDELGELLDSFKNGAHPDVKDEGIGVSNYQKGLRVFYRFHDLGIDPDDVEIEEQGGRNLQPDDLLFQDDVDTIMTGLLNLRDRALFTLMLATGQRLDAVRTLRLKHVSMDGRTMDVRLNEEEGRLKGANGKKPLLWSKHYVREWVEAHPYAGDGEAAVFCALPDGRGMHGVPDGEEREPLKGQTIRDILTRAADRSGLEKRVYPHLLRSTAITRMVLEDLSEQKIKRVVGWSPDSSQFMTYVALADELTNDSIRESLGLPTSDEGTPIIGRPTLDRCLDCGDQLPEGRERCLTCGAALTNAAAEEPDPTERSLRETLAELPPEKARVLLQASDIIESNPGLRSAFENPERR